MNWKERGRKRSWPTFRRCAEIYLQWRRWTTKS